MSRCSKRLAVKQRWFHGTRQALGALNRTLVAIGNFDGVHKGHQRVLSKACELARARGFTPVVLTFDPHPAVVLAGRRSQQLCTLERKIELVLRVDAELRVVVEPFDLAVSKMNPREFAQTVLREGLDSAMVLVGNNFRFGHERAGDLSLLKELGSELGFEATALPLVGDDEGVYSSTRVRDALALGKLEVVWNILGRPHSLTGKVVEGQRLARKLGFPTANLGDVRELLPRHGVYSCAVDIEGAAGFERLGLGALNVGVRPTVQAGPSTEVHVLDLDEDLYGKVLRVHLVERIRDEKRFDSLDALVSQIASDRDRVRELSQTLSPAVEAGPSWF